MTNGTKKNKNKNKKGNILATLLLGSGYLGIE